jgi:lipid A 3-O-deacylase
MRRRLFGVCIGFLWLFLLSVPLQGESWSLLHDNDLVFNSDDHYTGGVQIGWMSDPYGSSGAGSFGQGYVTLLSRFVSLFGVSFEGRQRSGAIGLHELIITPEDLNSTEPIYDDVPYVGVLSGTFSLFSWDADDFEEFRLSLGVIGPSSGAEAIQKSVHSVTGSAEPRGWGNQLGTHMLLQAGYLRGARHYLREYGGNRRLEWCNSYSVDLGNFYSGIGAGSLLRFGRNMPANFVTASGLLSSSQSNRIGVEERGKEPGWEIRAGIGASAVGYLYLYDEAKARGYSFERPRLIPRGNIGATYYWEGFHLSLDLFPAGSVGANPKSKSFGRINLVWVSDVR